MARRKGSKVHGQADAWGLAKLMGKFLIYGAVKNFV